MTKLNGKNKKRVSLLFVISLTLLLFGCSPVYGEPITQPASAQDIAVGNIEKGRDLFMGNIHFHNGGPPCMGCHNVGENGLLGGGAMGPDLTDISNKRSQTEIVSILSNYGWTISPVMEPIYTEHPLTVIEQADLIAFLIASEGQPETNKEPIVLGISLAGSVVAAVALGFFYRGRMRGARKPLVNEAKKELP